MSAQSSRAAGRRALGALMQRMLQVILKPGRNRSPGAASTHPASTRSRRSAPSFETLEPRLLLSADLVGDLSSVTLPDQARPSEGFSVPVIVRNIGADASTLTPIVRLFASSNGQVDARSFVLGESKAKNDDIAPGRSITVAVPVDVSSISRPGAYSLIAVVDADNRVAETNENNNTVIASGSLNVAWSFGDLPGHAHADSVTLTDAAGTKVTFKLSGSGQGNVVRDGDAFSVQITGTNAKSTLKITTAGGLGYATVKDLLVDASLNSLQAPDIDLAGRLEIGGTVHNVELRNIRQDGVIAIAGSGVAVDFVAARVTGAEINSASAIESIAIENWINAGSDAGAIRAPSIGKLVVGGEFAGNLNLSGAGSGLTLGSAAIGGRISGELWNVRGAAGTISAQSIAATWQGSFALAVDKVTTKGDMAGQLAAGSIGTIQVGGSLTNALVLAGVNLGSDGRLGGTGDAADQFFQGTLGNLRVDQSIRDSLIYVGVDPRDGIYGNGNDAIIGGQASRIGSVTVGSALLGATRIVAGAFPGTVKIGGVKLSSANVPQLYASVPDIVAPQISVSLIDDTGASASDRITMNAGVSGQIVEAGSLATFRVALDNVNPSGFVDVKTRVQPDGRFTLDAAALGSIFGAPLSDGAHTLYLRATDGGGNVATSSLAFTLDSRAPATVSIELDPSSDTGIAGDHLTRNGLVSLRGTTEPGVEVKLAGTGLTTQSDGDGNFSFGNIALTEGTNTFTVRAIDLAGNETQSSSVISRDATAPFLVAALQNDSGFSNSDSWTNDPTISGYVSDASSVVSVTVGFTGGSATEIVAVPATDFGFVLSADFLDGVAGGVIADGPHVLRLQARDAAGNVSITDVAFILDRLGPTVPRFDLAPESDTGTPDDQQTTLSVVSFIGLSDANVELTLEGTDLLPVWAGNLFRFDGVNLAPGANALTVRAVDFAGNQSLFTRTIFLDAVPPQGGFPDLAVTSIDSHVIGIDGLGQTLLQVDWTTANLGSATAHGLTGAWAESVYLSQFDDLPFSDDDFLLGFTLVTEDLDAGAQRSNSLLVAVPDWAAPGYRIYIVVDDDLGFIANQIFEKAAGEYNNFTVEDVPSGIAPPDIAESGPELPLSDSPIGGSIAAPGEVDVFTFVLSAPTRLYFDSLSANPDMVWTLKNSEGVTVLSRSFASADAFGIGNANPLIGLTAGSYELAVSNGAGQTGSYAFRLFNVDAAASHNLVFDGGPLLGQILARGNQTDVYQFEAAAGQTYVVGGPGDSTIEGALFWRLFDPNGNQIWTGQASPSDIGTFALDGNYTLLVEGRVGRTDPTHYNVYVFTPQDRQFEVTTGEHVQGFLDAPGQVNTYSFALTEASALFFDGQLSSNGPYFEWTLFDSSSALATGNTRMDSGADGIGAPLIHLDVGSYTLRVEGQGDASGWYNFRLIDVLHDPAPTLTFGTGVDGALFPGFGSALYRFEGQAGQAITISLTTFDLDWVAYDPARWILVDPLGTAVLSGDPSMSMDAYLGTSGNWSLLVVGRQVNWEPVFYNVAVNETVIMT